MRAELTRPAAATKVALSRSDSQAPFFVNCAPSLARTHAILPLLGLAGESVPWSSASSTLSSSRAAKAGRRAHVSPPDRLVARIHGPRDLRGGQVLCRGRVADARGAGLAKLLPGVQGPARAASGEHRGAVVDKQISASSSRPGAATPTAYTTGASRALDVDASVALRRSTAERRSG